MARKRSTRGGQSAAKDSSSKAAKTTKPETIKATETKKAPAKAAKSVETKVMGAASPAEKTNAFKSFFAKKYEGKENVDSLFGSPKLVAALVAEILGSFILVMVTLTTQASPLFVMFGVLAAALLAYKISGAMLNPVVTLGALVTRRISAIRALFYIIAQVLGAMLAYIALKAFLGAAVEDSMTGAPTIYSMISIPEGRLGLVFAIEVIGAAIITLFFARAIQSRKSLYTFGAIFAGGVFAATIFAMSASSYIGTGFAINPALAVAMEAFTKVPENFGVNALAYIVAPLIGGIIGFIVSDLMTRAANAQEA
ncbi:aquaporin [Candidatus Saccharibacteria bacterium]|nr:aquaporin [Candidatus Saccharibacteria bacterium]